jgi:hypothetical protein
MADSATTLAQRKKMIVAGLLGVVLLIVVAMPSGPKSTDGSKPTTPVSQSATVVRQDSSPAQTASKAASSVASVNAQRLSLPEVDMSLILLQDPFLSRKPVEHFDKSEANVNANLQPSGSPIDTDPSSQPELRESINHSLAVTAIMTGGQRPAALVDNTLYYENDRLENGWKIVAIKSNSILVERVQE